MRIGVWEGPREVGAHTTAVALEPLFHRVDWTHTADTRRTFIKTNKKQTPLAPGTTIPQAGRILVMVW